MSTAIADKAIPVTGANRGLGQALVEDGLRRGARRVYAGTRGPLTHRDGRVTVLILDVTDTEQIRAAAESVESLDGVEHGEEEVFPDPLAATMAESWRSSTTKDLERQNAALLGGSHAAA